MKQDRIRSVDEAGARRLGDRVGERAIFGAVGADQHRDPVQVILGLLTIALLELPQTVILPGADVDRDRPASARS